MAMHHCLGVQLSGFDSRVRHPPLPKRLSQTSTLFAQYLRDVLFSQGLFHRRHSLVVLKYLYSQKYFFFFYC